MLLHTLPIRGSPISAGRKPKLEVGIAPCPAHVQGEARGTRRRIARKLHRIGLQTEIDGMALAALRQSWVAFLDATAKLKQTGMLVKSPSGSVAGVGSRGSPAHLDFTQFDLGRNGGFSVA